MFYDHQYHTRTHAEWAKNLLQLGMGKGPGERGASGIFTYAKPKDQLQRNHNKEALGILETKRSQLTLERQAIGTGIMPTHKFKGISFFEFLYLAE